MHFRVELGETETKQTPLGHVRLPLNCGRIDAVPRTVKSATTGREHLQQGEGKELVDHLVGAL
jgi:hypothetical protein